jgi:radical SAM domain protein
MNKKIKALMIYPEFPPTYWSFKYALKYIGKKSSFPPLGLITLAAMFPKEWDVQLVDMNVEKLLKRDIQSADIVFVSAMSVQQKSAEKTIRMCQALGKKVVCGGPLFSCEPEKYSYADCLVLYEGEVNFPDFLRDFQAGNVKRVYGRRDYPEMSAVPVPRWELVKVRKYAGMCLQFSRGCPYDCDFCNVTSLFGRTPRTKSVEQVLAELDAICATGWNQAVFFVDDNFIGNKPFLKNTLLPALIKWQQSQKTKIPFFTEASINLSDDDALMALMRVAGFDSVFIGIETPDDASLKSCNKYNNAGRDLVECVKKIQRYGMQVQAGFIVGFDTDTESIFQRQIDFIQKSGIVIAMVGILQAPIGTKLYQKMKEAGRIASDWSGNNVAAATNIVTKMNSDTLANGYRKIFEMIYSHKNYYKRIREFLVNYEVPAVRSPVTISGLMAFMKANVRLGIFSGGRFQYWSLLAWVMLKKRALLPEAVRLSIMGLHFRKVYSAG